jgi:hypothetical protein
MHSICLPDAPGRETGKTAPAPSIWLPTDAWVRLLLVPVLVFVSQASSTTYLADFWHHLARGRVIVTEGQLLDHDVFTFTAAGQSFQDVNWLSQVVYYLLFSAGGLALVQVVNALVMAIALGLLVGLCKRLSGSLVTAMVVGIAVFLGLWQVLTIRPQTFSLLLFVILFDVLERSERRPWLLAVPPALLALWANLHGAFPAGLMLVGCFLATAGVVACKDGRLWRDGRTAQLAGCLVACVLATLINPYGVQIYLYVGLTSNRAAARGIDEWVAPSFDQAIGVAFFVSVAALALLVALNWRCFTDLRAIVLALCFAPLAAGSVRMVAWWLLAMAPVAAVLLAKLLPAGQTAESKPTVGAALTCAVLVLLSIFSVPGLQAHNPLLAFRSQQRVEHDLDVVLGRLCQEKDVKRVFTRFEWGEYLTWAADWRLSVFMDGRIEIFSDQVWKEYESVTVGRDGWAKILDDYWVDALILDSDYHARTGLLAKVDAAAEWVRVFQARTALLYLRENHRSGIVAGN